MVLWWSLGSDHEYAQAACFIVRKDVVWAVKIILFVFRLWLFFRDPEKLLWKGKQDHRTNCFGINFRYPLFSLLLQAGSGQDAQSFAHGSLELSKAEEVLQAVWFPDCPQWNFFSCIQLEFILSIYDSCLSFSYCALWWGAHLSSMIILQGPGCWDLLKLSFSQAEQAQLPSALLTGQVLQP